MARGTTLEKALYMLKGELGLALSPGAAPAADDELMTLIEQRQAWLYSEFDWPFLKTHADVAILADARYGTIPTTINFERPVRVETLYNDVWCPVFYGIGSEEYNAISSGDEVTASPQDPIYKWDYKRGDDASFEVWPLPASAQTVRFYGLANLTDLRRQTTGGFSFSRAAELNLDDTLIVLFAAADRLMRQKSPDAQMKLTMAQQRLARLRATSPSRSSIIGLSEEPATHKYVYRKPRLS